MFRTVGPSGSLFELLLPPGMRVLSGELAEIDQLLDDPRFFRPFRAFFDPTEGRPSIPMETYLRLLFLKCRFKLGYEQLWVQVNDSLSWRRFCRIGLEARVPDESTIRKLTRRLGPDVVDELNGLLLGLAAEDGHLHLERVRVDTTVVEADIKYPTDSGLLTKAISRIAVLMRRIEATGMTATYTDRTLAARHHAHEIARPIAKGRLGRPVEFGYKAQVCDNEHGLIVDHSVHVGNPHDTDLLLPAVARIVEHCGTAPVLLTADRGYCDKSIEADLTDAGIVTVVIPKTGKPSAARLAIERADSFVDAVKWRTGAEGRISCLKRDLGWRRTRLRSHDGTRIWCGHGVFAHNLTKLNKLRQ